MQDAVAAVRHLLPLTVEIEPLKFYTQQEVHQDSVAPLGEFVSEDIA